MPLAVALTVAGLQVPLIPLSDVVGRAGTDPPEHILRLEPNGNVGGTFGFTVTSNMAVVAHNPAVGVKV